jgi:hypothetical protein
MSHTITARTMTPVRTYHVHALVALVSACDLTSLPHTLYAPSRVKLFCLSKEYFHRGHRQSLHDPVKDAVNHVPTRQLKLGYHKQPGLGTCRNIHVLFILRPFDHNCLTTHSAYTCSTVTRFVRGCVQAASMLAYLTVACIRKIKTRRLLFLIISLLRIFIMNYTAERLWTNSFSILYAL